MQAEIKKNTIEVDHELSNDLTSILEGAGSKVTPFMNPFWQQQKKSWFSSSSGVRYHLMLFTSAFPLL